MPHCLEFENSSSTYLLIRTWSNLLALTAKLEFEGANSILVKWRLDL